MKPIVDGLESDLKGALKVIRLDVQDATGQALGALYGFRFTPTFILLDGKGEEIFQSIGVLDVEKVKQAIRP